MEQSIKKIDKVLGIVLFSSFLFWTLSKIKIERDSFVAWDIFYSVTWPLWTIAALGITVFFLIRWVQSKFGMNFHLLLSLLGLVTLAIMRFIY